MNILIAEDDASTRRLISFFLKNKGYTIFEASDGEEALKKILKNRIQIAILDWVLPYVNGIDICREIRKKENLNYTYIVMLTSKTEKEDQLLGFEAGVDEYLLKPTNLNELYARIKVGERILHLEQKLKEQQQKLAEMNELKNKFLGIAAHDLRNPIISIRGFSELLLKKSEHLDEEQKEFLNVIHSSSRNMLAMLNDLLDISQIESGRLEISKKPESLKHIIEECVQINSLHAKQKNITIHQELEDIPKISIDPMRINQGIDNLINNAVKFAPYGTNIYLQLSREGDIVKFSVADEGPGIPLDEQPFLFSEFRRLSIRPTAGETTTGLGLAITKRVMEAHGGSIEYYGKEDKGSTFVLYLPIHPADTPQITGK